jgi:acyl dehydratase
LDVNAVGRSVGPLLRTWDERDCLIYALGVGAGSADPLAELRWTTENSQGHTMQVLPTLAAVLAAPLRSISDLVGELDWTRMLHAAQTVELHTPLPSQGRVQLTTCVSGIYDKGSAALIELETVADDEASGAPMFSTRSTVFVRGAGGWGGDRGPAAAAPPPDRAPDETVTMVTRPDQPLLYRLSGDRNRLHSDPAFAALAGFERPILHGLCTYGFTGRALVSAICDGDAREFRSMSARFARPVMPGDQLTAEFWRLGEGNAAFRTRNGRGEVVLDGGHFVYGG